MHNIEQIVHGIEEENSRSIARAISIVEDGDSGADQLLDSLDTKKIEKSMLVGITGAPGAGKSTLTNRLVEHCRDLGKRVGVVAIDPSSPISGGAIHGDRIRMMQHAMDREVVVRSMATRGRLGGLCASAGAAVRVMAAGGCDPVFIETVGVGQSEMDIIQSSDITALVSAPGLGDDIQALKAGLLEVADIMVVNKADCPGADLLCMELEEVAQEKGRRVFRTVAAKNEGIEALFSYMRELFSTHRESGESARRRKQARQREIVDWSMEMLRPYVNELCESREDDLGTDPKIRALEITQRLLQDDDSRG